MKRLLFAVFVLVAVWIAVGCRKGGLTTDGRAAQCGTFTGGNLNASWSQCPDKVQRQVSCYPFVQDLHCDCIEDGAKTWFFTATNPPLASREDATRVANANCHWSLE